jgi:urease accessory protein
MIPGVRLAALLLLFLLGAPPDASAHAVAQGSDAFTAGALHPFSLPSHLLNLTGLGLLIGTSDLRKRIAAVIFCGGILCGLGATARIYVSPTELWLPVSAGIVGILVAGAWRLPRGVVGAIVVVIGVMLGLDSRPETPFLRDALLSFAGTTLGAGLAALAIAFVASLASARWQQIGVRVLGSWIAATAILVSALQFAR